MPRKKKDTNQEILRELDELRQKEDELIKKVTTVISEGKKNKKGNYLSVAHLTFNDFAQVVIGCCVFGLPAFINTSFWDYLPLIKTPLLFWIHIFFSGCVLMALNYEFQDDIKRSIWFIKNLIKRFFYHYVSVAFVVGLIMITISKLSYSMTLLEVTRNFYAAQSVGLFGAITFNFFKK